MDCIANRYKLQEQLGQGGMGSVWRAYDQLLQRDVAVKTVPLGDDPNSISIKRFQREAVAMANISHPNVASVYDTGVDADTAFLVMELLPDGDLLHKILKGNLSFPRMCLIGADIASALQAAHRAGVVHRDVKPANILFDKETPKVLDFGIAHLTQEAGERLTKAATTVGTATYISPEQAMGKVVTGASDTYSFGCLLFAMFTGRPPFEFRDAMQVARAHVKQTPKDMREIKPDIPAPLAELVAGLLLKNPIERPPLQEARRVLLNLRQDALEANPNEAATMVMGFTAPIKDPEPAASRFSASDAPTLISVNSPKTYLPQHDSEDVDVFTSGEFAAQSEVDEGFYSNKDKDPMSGIWRWLIPLLVLLFVVSVGLAIWHPWEAQETAHPGAQSSIPYGSDGSETTEDSSLADEGAEPETESNSTDTSSQTASSNPVDSVKSEPVNVTSLPSDGSGPKADSNPGDESTSKADDRSASETNGDSTTDSGKQPKPNSRQVNAAIQKMESTINLLSDPDYKADLLAAWDQLKDEYQNNGKAPEGKSQMEWLIERGKQEQVFTPTEQNTITKAWDNISQYLQD